MIGQIKNNGIHNPYIHSSVYRNVTVRAERDFFSMQIDGKEYAVDHPEHRENINQFLALGGAERKETVAAVLYKGIEPTKENLEQVHQALNEDVFRQEVQATEVELDPEIIEKMDIPDEIKERILSERAHHSKSLSKAVKSILSELKILGDRQAEALTLKEALSVLSKAFRPHSATQALEADYQASLPTLDSPVSAFVSNSDFAMKSILPPVSRFENEFETESLIESETETESKSVSAGASPALSSPDATEKNMRRRTIGQDDAGVFEKVPASKESHTGNSTEKAPVEVTEKESNHVSEKAFEHLSEQRVENPSLSADGEEWEIQIEEMVNLALRSLDLSLDQIFHDLEIKKFIVTKTDEMMVRATQEFREMKTSVMESLDKGMIAKAIETLSKNLNKATFAMLTDMPTEKKLLIGLSRLEEAANALKNKDMALAQKIVREVRTLVGDMEFRPSARTVRAMIFQRAQSTEKALNEQPVTLQDQIAEAVKVHSSGTARDVLELVRFSGLNHEIERYENTGGVGGLRNLKELFPDSSFAASMSGEQMLNNSDD
ncbi:MAG: hypothetical protein Q4A41_06685, partial [Bacillota bacterium]|nr:hypothetical protein [Bacillota bacterium]